MGTNIANVLLKVTRSPGISDNGINLHGVEHSEPVVESACSRNYTYITLGLV
jgi:hypothetical protein